jgi:hypothetical protein
MPWALWKRVSSQGAVCRRRCNQWLGLSTCDVGVAGGNQDWRFAGGHLVLDMRMMIFPD